MFHADAFVLHFMLLVPPNGWSVKQKNWALKIPSAALSTPGSWHSTTENTVCGTSFYPGMNPQTTFPVIILIYTDIHIDGRKPRRITCTMAALLPTALRSLTAKKNMIVDIKWIQAGCCGCDVLFSHEAAVHDADLACVKNHMCFMLRFHTSSTNGVFLRCPLAAMVFLPSTNFFAAYKTKNGTEICFNNNKKKPFQIFRIYYSLWDYNPATVLADAVCLMEHYREALENSQIWPQWMMICKIGSSCHIR